ncbi:hypothetical protein DBV39_08530 [Orrella marina]|uniref:LPS-assembly lipoprotein LptE n=2 Tax=Orrella marina TaxID=2163011 RepID=A0A2R4XPJ9_9BURK|nr:hypothetical protein DBV39_08530 [Orrella marina]
MLALTILLTACGFRLQGTTPLPFERLSITIPDNTQFGADVRRAIRAASPDTVIVSNEPLLKGEKPNFQAQLQQVSVSRNIREVSLNPQGRVEEYELTLIFTFRLVNARSEIILPDTTLVTVRDLPYDDNVVQAKEGEIATLFEQMQRSMVDRLMRRITSPDVIQTYERLERKAAQEK